MTAKIRRVTWTVGLMAALLASGHAQERARGLDPSTGRRDRPVERSQRSHPHLALPGTGDRIGYTTDVLTPHTLTLVEFIAASDDLLADGHRLVPIDTLDATRLAGIDRLFVGWLAQPMPAEDMDAIEAFVRSGGSLVYLGDNNRFWRSQNVQVGGRFGIEYPNSDPPEVVLTDIAEHPITSGPFGEVNTICGTSNAAHFLGSMSSPGPHGRGLVLFPDGSSFTVVIEAGDFAPGAGCVIALSDANVLFDDYFLGDNRALWRNVFAYAPPSTRVAFDFETEDDSVTPLVNGQAVQSPEEFGRTLSLAGFGPHTYGAAIFDSSPGGANAAGSDPDLLVDLGNILILQENGQQTVPGFYDDLDDAQLGGTLVFDFVEPVLVESIDLIDICPGPPNQDVTLTLFDQEFRTRTYFVPGGWTSDLFQDGSPGYATLDLTTLEPQPGFLATTTAEQVTTFSPTEVIRLEVLLNGSGAVDNLVVDLDPPVTLPFGIVACSLGCVGDGAGQITCLQTDVFVNGEIEITFSTPFDLSTVNTNTFRVLDLMTGTTPPGMFDVAPSDDRTLVWRPQLAFDSAGNPFFGLTDGGTYLLSIPGSLLDPLGPYIESATGEPNQTRLLCVLSASLGVMDVVPGPPSVAITVFPDQPAQGAVDVARETDITFAFDDVMNPATLLNSVTGVSPTLTVEVDADGDLGTTEDRSPVAGLFSIAIDPGAEATTVVFDPTGDLPALAWILVTTTDAITDLAGNGLSNHGTVSFRTAE